VLIYMCRMRVCRKYQLDVQEYNREDKTHPNLCRMEMDGYINGDVKTARVRYMCSECNTGVWHGEFDKKLATMEEKLLASFSECNAITPLDHPDGCLTGGYDNYHVDERYLLFVELFGKGVNSSNNLLFKIYLEDRMNFDIQCLIDLKNSYFDKCGIDKYVYTENNKLAGYTKLTEVDSVVELYNLVGSLIASVSHTYDDIVFSAAALELLCVDTSKVYFEESLREGDYLPCLNDACIGNAIRNSQIYKSESKSVTFRNYGHEGSSRRMNQLMTVMGSSMASMGIDPSMLITGSKRQPKKKHWKDEQSLESKNEALEKARLKRERKALKRKSS